MNYLGIVKSSVIISLPYTILMVCISVSLDYKAISEIVTQNGLLPLLRVQWPNYLMFFCYIFFALCIQGWCYERKNYS